MNSTHYYSVRMHASASCDHLSGAERLVTKDGVESAVAEVLSRAFGKQRMPQNVSITVDDLGSIVPRAVTALDLIPVRIGSVDQGRLFALEVLRLAGVSTVSSSLAIEEISRGASTRRGNMRGAMIIDSQSGERLEPDRDRGVRASRFDWSADAGKFLNHLLEKSGLVHFRTREALALATKIAHGPGVRAELCWSDDSDYCAGYVASLRTGYVRIPLLKQSGDGMGGRAIFIDSGMNNLEHVIRYLEAAAILISRPGVVHTETDSEGFLQSIQPPCLNTNLRL
jgi:6-carboxyhexanoate--CoA ligase